MTPRPNTPSQEVRALLMQLRGAKLTVRERTRIQMRLDELRAQANG